MTWSIDSALTLMIRRVPEKCLVLAESEYMYSLFKVQRDPVSKVSSSSVGNTVSIFSYTLQVQRVALATRHKMNEYSHFPPLLS